MEVIYILPPWLSESYHPRQAAAAAGEGWPHRCRFVVANFGVEDITAEMGATEVWPRAANF
jgi:hypothetical protein